MKCLACKQNEGTKRWLLLVDEIPELNLKEKFDLDNCLCSECSTTHLADELNKFLAEYYLSQLTKPSSHYYKWHPVSECVEISQEFNGNLAQAMQYIWRSETLNPNAVTKGQTIEDIIKDLEKAQNFIGYEIDRLKGKNTNA